MKAQIMRQPLTSELQLEFNIHCRLEGNKRVVFTPKKESEIRKPSHLAFWCDSGFVPFRKNVEVDKYRWFHKKEGASIKPTPETKTTWFAPGKSGWKTWNRGRNRTSDARDATYLYSCKNNGIIGDSETVDNHGHPRPNTVARSHTISSTPRIEPNGCRRVYTAVERSKTEQAKARREYLVGKGFSTRLSNRAVSSMAVTQMLPCKSAVLERSPKHIIRDTTQPNKSVKLPDHLVDRPLKRECGHYRPFSRTIVRTPDINFNGSPVPEHKDQASVETFKQIQRSSQIHNRATPSRETHLRSFHTKNTINFLHFDDSHTHLLQSVIDVNKPPSRMTSARTEINESVG